MAPKFTMNSAETQSGLSNSDASAAAQPASNVGSLWVGGYTTPLVGAILGTRAVGEAKTEGRVAVNAATREVSVSTIEGAEEANSSVLTT
jgi:hypothetical protein